MTSASPTERPAKRPRVTKQRLAVDEALGSVEEFVSAQQLHDVLRERGARVGLATVYRALQVMVDAGEVDTLRTEDGETLYRRCEREAHHHHLVCRNCRTAVELEVTGFEEWMRSVGTKYGFADVDHTIELTGLCARCA